MEPKNLRLVLLGKTGTGKSATGNTILSSNTFPSQASPSSVTKHCMEGTTELFGRPVLVVDTPGLFDTELSNEEVTKEIVRVVSMTAPGPHVFLLTLHVGRFSKEENESIEKIRKTFGNDMLKFTILIFTSVGSLRQDGCNLKTYINRASGPLKQLIEDCGGRYLGVENKDPQQNKDEKIEELVTMATSLQVANKVPYYTDEMFKEATKSLQKVEEEARRVAEKERLAREAELRKTLEDEKQAELAKVKKNFDKQVKEMKISEDDRVRQEKQYRHNLEEVNNGKFQEMMKEFKKTQDENYRKEHDMRLMKAQQDFAKSQLESEKQIKAMKYQHEKEMEKMRRDANEKEAKLQNEMYKVQSDVKMSDQQARQEMRKLEEKLEAMKVENVRKLKELQEATPEKRKHMFKRLWNFVAGD